MSNYCARCGSVIHSNARFCARCGAAVTPEPPLNGPAPSPKPLPESKLHQRDSAGTRQHHTPAAKAKSNTLCIVLAVLLVVQTVVVALFGWPGFAVGGRKQIASVLAKNSFTLQDGQTEVAADSGMTVNFGPYNEMNGETVSIETMSADMVSVEGGVRRAFDVNAGERTQFDGLITMTVPYDESETDPADEAGSVLAEYFNEQANAWEPVDYTVNTADNTVTITTDHLSSYCTVTMQDAGSPYALLSRFSGRTLDDESALAVLQEFEQRGQPGEVGDTLLRVFYTQFLPEDVVGNEEAELLNEVLGWLTDVSELAAAGSGYGKVAEVMQNSGYMLLGLSAVSLGGTMYDAYKGDESAEAAATQAYKLAYSTALAWADYKHITAGALQVSMLGVIAIDYTLNRFMAAADQTYKDALFNTVIAYNEVIHPRSDEEWYAMILKLYENHSENPDRFNKGLEALLYHFSERYFQDDPEEQRVARNEADIHAYTTDILPVTENAKQYCIEQYVARLGQRLKPVMEDVMRRIRYDAHKGFRGTTTELQHALNAPLAIQIREDVPDGETSKYAGTIAVLSRPGGRINDSWTVILDENGSAAIDATILGYIQAGVPTQLRLWQKGDNHYEDAPQLTQTFAVTKENTVIVLEDAGIDAKWFGGSWRNLDYSTVMQLEIGNDAACSYTASIDGQDITTKTTYIFDKASSALTLAPSSDNGTNGRIWIPEIVFFGYEENGADYLRTANSRYERVK